jgi:UDP-glucuronate decarboxylase
MHPNDGRVVSTFIVQALIGRDLTVFGDGRQTRSFCYVDDLVGGFMKMMASADDVTGPINLGNPSEFTMLELAEQIIDLTGSKSKIVHMPLPQDDPKQRRPDITLANGILDWRPTVSLRAGLMKTISYFDDQLKFDRVRAVVGV